MCTQGTGIQLHSLSGSNRESEQTDIHSQLRQAAAEQNFDEVLALVDNKAGKTSIINSSHVL